MPPSLTFLLLLSFLVLQYSIALVVVVAKR
jgi:hypothetical protein